jgi:hypothetical protein
MTNPRRGEGRIRRGMRLVRGCIAFLRQRPRMVALPAISALLSAIVTGLVTAVSLTIDEDGSGLGLAVAVAIGFFPVTVIATFFNVAFLAMAEDAANGFEPTVAGGLRTAEDRLGPILAWSALSTGVGVLLQAIQQIPYVGGSLGRIIAAVGGLAWGLATFFVVPIIALHGTGARESLRRSARTFKERWGETVTGDLAIGLGTMIIWLPALIVAGVGIGMWMDGVPSGAVLIAIGLLVAVPALVLQSALTSLFQLFVYRHVALGTSDGPFAVDDLERAVKPKPRRRWWRLGA